MIITENLKSKVKRAKEDGFKYVYVTLGAYRATTYITVWNIERILSNENGSELTYHHHGKWTGQMNTRHLTGNEIMYSSLFSKYK